MDIIVCKPSADSWHGDIVGRFYISQFCEAKRLAEAIGGEVFSWKVIKVDLVGRVEGWEKVYPET